MSAIFIHENLLAISFILFSALMRSAKIFFPVPSSSSSNFEICGNENSEVVPKEVFVRLCHYFHHVLLKFNIPELYQCFEQVKVEPQFYCMY